MFTRDTGLRLSFFVVSPSGFGIWVMLVSQNVFRVFCTLRLSGDVAEGSELVLESSAEFTSEAVGSAAFLCWETSDGRLNLLPRQGGSDFLFLCDSVLAGSVLLVSVPSLRSPRLLESARSQLS